MKPSSSSSDLPPRERAFAFTETLDDEALQGKRALARLDRALETIEAVLDDLEGLTGTQVSQLSHEEPAWRHTEPGATIPYELAFVAKDQVVTPTARRLAAEVAARYGLAAAG